MALQLLSLTEYGKLADSYIKRYFKYHKRYPFFDYDTLHGELVAAYIRSDLKYRAEASERTLEEFRKINLKRTVLRVMKRAYTLKNKRDKLIKNAPEIISRYQKQDNPYPYDIEFFLKNAGLPPKQKLYIDYYLKGFSQARIAEITSTRPENISLAIGLAIKKMKRLIK